MNINLLPIKFIRNRAFEVILFSAVAALIGVVAFALSGYFFYQIQANNYKKSLNTTQVEKRVQEQKVQAMAATKSETLQAFILEQKKEYILFEPMMTALEQKVQSVGATIFSYSLSIPDPFDEAADSVIVENNAQDGSELLPALTVVVEGQVYDNIIKLAGAFETIDWVYDVKYKSIANEEHPAQAEITLRFIKEKVPKAQVKEDNHD